MVISQTIACATPIPLPAAADLRNGATDLIPGAFLGTGVTSKAST